MPARQMFAAIMLLSLAAPTGHAAELSVGFAEVDVTPDVRRAKPVWMAGYGYGRRATSVHDPIMLRAVVLQDSTGKLAFVSVDLVGLQYPTVQQIRAKLEDYRYVLVSSTHNHEGPDVIGIWGKTPFQRGVDDDYLQIVAEGAVQATRAAEQALQPARAEYGTAEDESLLGDGREPYVKDGILRLLRFRRESDGGLLGVLVQWNCHPESLGSRNTAITADFPYYTVKKLREHWQCPVAYFSGAVGGLMSNPSGRVKNAAGQTLDDGNFEYAQVYGEEVAQLAERALAACQPLTLTPFIVSAKPIAIEIENKIYRAAREVGVLKRPGRIWTGNAEQIGPPPTLDTDTRQIAIETEVAYLRLGELHVAGIPGELYPELVYGKVQDPVDPGADFPAAAVEPSVVELLPGPKWLLFGLANDEIGYIIPKRQWDADAPFCYGRTKTQYGEINSCGPNIAPIVMRALARRVSEADGLERIK